MLSISNEELTMHLYQWAVGGKMHPLVGEVHLSEQSRAESVFSLMENLGADLEEQEYLTDDDLKALIVQMTDMGVRDFRFVGSVSNHYDKELLFSLLTHIKGKGVTKSIISNGMSLSANDIKKMLDDNVNQFEFSMGGPDDNTHYAHHVNNGSWENNTTALQILNKFIENQPGYSPKICINVLLTRSNWNKLPNTIRFAHRSGADSFQIWLPDPSKEWSKELNISLSQARELLLIKDDLVNLCNIYHMEHNLETYLQDRLLFPTRVPKEKIKVRTDEPTPGLPDFLVRYKKRFPKMEESFLRFATLADYIPWFFLGIGPEGIYIPQGNKYVAAGISDHSIEEIWFGDEYNQWRSRVLAKGLERAYERHTLLGPGGVKKIQRGLLKRWKEAYLAQPQKSAGRGNILTEYRNKEAKVKLKMLDRDILLLEKNIRDVKRRMDLYSKDKERIIKLRRSVLFRWYQGIRRTL